MGDGGGAEAVAGLVAFGVLSWGVVALVDLIAIATVGLALGILVLAAVVVLGVITYGRYLGEAVRTRNRSWAVDIILAPVVAFGISYLFFTKILSEWRNMIVWGNTHFSQNYAAKSWLAGTLFDLTCIVLFLGSPIAAVVWMGEEDRRFVRVGSYVAFTLASMYWVVMAIAIVRGTNLNFTG